MQALWIFYIKMWAVWLRSLSEIFLTRRPNYNHRQKRGIHSDALLIITKNKRHMIQMVHLTSHHQPIYRLLRWVEVQYVTLWVVKLTISLKMKKYTLNMHLEKCHLIHDINHDTLLSSISCLYKWKVSLSALAILSRYLLVIGAIPKLDWLLIHTCQ